MKRTLIILILCIFTTTISFSQNILKSDYLNISKKMIDLALSEGKAYEMLRELCFNVGPRLTGSPAAAAAVEWGRQALIKSQADSVFLQDVMVPHWVRGDIETATLLNLPTLGTIDLTVCALGRSVGTPETGVTGDVIEVKDFDELKAMGEKVKGKIVFYNRPMDPKKRNTFMAYSGAVDQRGAGAIEAAKLGAVAVLVRSMTTRLDDVPHTGAMREYEEGVRKIPAAAISTVDANLLSHVLKTGERVSVNLKLSCKTLPDVLSANVIGEIIGIELPDEVILLGGHLDSWDKGHGAHDDGSGCVQSIEALRLIKAMGLKPKRTIRAVLFMNEENGVRGGQAYADSVGQSGPKHIVAIESDRGGFTPRGLTIKAEPGSPELQSISKWSYLFEGIDADKFISGYGGVDISPLEPFGTLLMGLSVDPHRYFDYHHSDNDTFDKVNERELELGAVVMAMMSYVLAMEGI